MEWMVQKPMHIFFISRCLQDVVDGAVREGMVQKLMHTFPCGGDGAETGALILQVWLCVGLG
jgi:hypothetical protein